MNRDPLIQIQQNLIKEPQNEDIEGQTTASFKRFQQMCDEHKSQLESVWRENAILHDEYEDMEAQYETENQELRAELDSCKSKNECLEAECHKLKVALEVKNEEFQRLQSHVANFQAKSRKTVRDLKAKNRKREIDHKNEIETLKKKFRSSEGLNKTQQEQIKDLESDLDRIKDTTLKRLDNEAARRKELSSKKLIVSDKKQVQKIATMQSQKEDTVKIEIKKEEPETVWTNLHKIPSHFVEGQQTPTCGFQF